MNRAMCLLGGIGLGAGLMSLLDPQQGKRRRSLIRDQAVSLLNETRDAAQVVARDLSHRAYGLAAETRSVITSGEASDDVIAERVRSKIGRVVSHPRAIDVRCRDGRVTLSGPVLAREVDPLLRCASAVRGVKGIEQSLDIHKEAGNIAGLQGGRPRSGRQIDLLQERWSPTSRFLVGSGGVLLTAYGLTKNAPTACVLGTVGLGLIARSLANIGIRQMIDLEPVRQTIERARDQSSQAINRATQAVQSMGAGASV